MSLTGNPELTESGLDNPPDNPLVLLHQWLETADRVGVYPFHLKGTYWD